MKTFLPALTAILMLTACGQPEPSPELTGQGYIQGTTDTESAAAASPETSVLAVSEERPAQYELLGQKLPAFTAPMADGTLFDSAALARWTVIGVWGAWCSDSVADGLYADALQRAVDQDPDLDFVSIHVPPSAGSETPEKPYGDYGSLEAYFESAGYTLPTVIDSDGSLREKLKINWTPTYLLVSPDGVVRSFRTDLSVDKDQPVKTFIKDIAEVRKDVRDLLASDPSDIQ